MPANAQLRHVAILSGNRIPSARSNMAYATASNQQMLTAVLQGPIDRFNLHGQRLNEVVAGAITGHARDLNLTRETVLPTTLAKQTPAYDIQQACGAGLEAAVLVASKTALGQIDVDIAGGTDITSDAPVGLNKKMYKIPLEANHAKLTSTCVKAPVGLWPSMFACPLLPCNSEPRTDLSMGKHCELMVKCQSIRREDQDALALRSHYNLTAAYERSFLADLMTVHLGLDHDNNLRSNLTIEQLAKLQPVFNRSATGTMTAGNSMPSTDGTSCVPLASEDQACTHNLPVLAYMTCADTAAVNFFSSTPEQNEGPLMVPTYTVSRMLQRAGLILQDFDYCEVHEVFVAQVLSMPVAWESSEYCHEKLGRSAPMGSIDRSKLNVNGSPLGTGHPFAATGGRIATVLAKMLAQRGGGCGSVSICAAGGQGVVAILECPETMSY